jgi:hypothetical protein
MRTHGSKFGVKTRPQNCQKLEKVVGKIEIFLAQKSNFLCSKFDFLQRLSNFREIRENLLQRLSDFFNAFLISVTAFKFSIFLNGFPIFLNGSPLSEKSGKNLSTAANIRKIAILASYFPLEIAIFCNKIIGGWNTNNWRLEYERSLFELRIFCFRAS